MSKPTLRQRRQEQGLTSVEVWLDEAQVARLDALVRSLGLREGQHGRERGGRSEAIRRLIEKSRPKP